jgi:hypothetical protein
LHIRDTGKTDGSPGIKTEQLPAPCSFIQITVQDVLA